MSEERDTLVDALEAMQWDMDNPKRIEYLKKMYNETAKGNAVGKFDKGFADHNERIQLVINSIVEKKEVDTPQKKSIVCEALMTLESQILHTEATMRSADPNANTDMLDSRLKTIDDLRKKYCEGTSRGLVDDVVEKIT